MVSVQDELRARTTPVAPWWLKGSVGFTALIGVGATPARGVISLERSMSLSDAVSVGLAILAMCAIIAIWRMRKWGVVVFAAMAVVRVLTASRLPGVTWRVPLFLAGLAALVLVPALVLWNRMLPSARKPAGV